MTTGPEKPAHHSDPGSDPAPVLPDGSAEPTGEREPSQLPQEPQPPQQPHWPQQPPNTPRPIYPPQQPPQNTDWGNAPNGQPLMPMQPGPNGPMYNYEEAARLASARKYVMAAQIMALVSLIIGGVVLSIAAIVVAVMGMGKLHEIAMRQSLDPMQERLFVRPATIAIGLCVLALVLNAVSLIMLYPIIMEMLETGDFTSFMQGGAASSTSTSPGESLFG